MMAVFAKPKSVPTEPAVCEKPKEAAKSAWPQQPWEFEPIFNKIVSMKVFSLLFYVVVNRLLRLLNLLDNFFPLQLAQGQQTLWHRAMDNKYSSLRIPALTLTTKGTLIAFCEGRKAGVLDSGAIDCICKRSEDNGKTWSKSSIIFSDGENTCGNPCAVVDQETGTIFLMMTHNLGVDGEPAIIEGTAKGSRTVWVCYSDDDGNSWSVPTNITSSAKQADWTWYATGPGVGIQLQHGKHAGRLLIPCDHMTQGANGVPGARSHIVYSDDHGKTWQLGGVSPEGHRTNECQVMERCDGSVVLNMRTMDRAVRKTCLSTDGGLCFRDIQEDPSLLDPRCQASVIKPSANEPVVLFSNPASVKSRPWARSGMTLRCSTDDGHTWSAQMVLHAGPAAYSSLCSLPDGTIACLFEAGRWWPYERIVLQLIPKGGLSIRARI
jgi:sialidase-1